MGKYPVSRSSKYSSAVLLGGAFSYWPLKQYANAQVVSFLYPDGSSLANFTEPKGADALVPAESISWQVFKNPLVLFLGGVAAVIMELAEPRVGAGVWQFSDFKNNPKRRLQRTGLAAMITVYAAKQTAERMIARVVRIHQNVRGQTDGGAVFHASDPELLTWVQATAMLGFLSAHMTYVAPISLSQGDAFWAEGQAASKLYGADLVPKNAQAMDVYFAGMLPLLTPAPWIEEFLSLMMKAPIMPALGRPLQGALLRCATALVPDALRTKLNLAPQWQASERDQRLVRLAVKAADKMVLARNPAVEACLRLGLPNNYLYKD